MKYIKHVSQDGRVTLPKPILSDSKIKDGDPVEITSDSSGVITIKKHQGLDSVRSQIFSLLQFYYHIYKKPAAVCNLTRFVASCGIRISGNPLPDKIISLINSKTEYVRSENYPRYLLEDDSDMAVQAVYPILSASEVLGAVVFAAPASYNYTVADFKNCKFFAGILNKVL